MITNLNYRGTLTMLEFPYRPRDSTELWCEKNKYNFSRLEKFLKYNDVVMYKDIRGFYPLDHLPIESFDHVSNLQACTQSHSYYLWFDPKDPTYVHIGFQWSPHYMVMKVSLVPKLGSYGEDFYSIVPLIVMDFRKAKNYIKLRDQPLAEAVSTLNENIVSISKITKFIDKVSKDKQILIENKNSRKPESFESEYNTLTKWLNEKDEKLRNFLIDNLKLENLIKDLKDI